MNKENKIIHLGKLFVIITLCLMLVFSCNKKIESRNHELLRILFIGNSYTFNNNLPDQVEKMFLDQNKTISIEIKSLTPGGARLQDHLNFPFTLDTIREGNWDIVILQGHSLEPLKNPIGFKDAALTLIKIAKDSGAEVYLFETWSRALGAPEYSEEWSGRNPDMMQKLISKEYIDVAISTDATVIPIGRIWQRLRIEIPEIGLYSTDSSHPTPCGSYLAACVIYKYLFDEDPSKLKYYPNGIKKSEAKKLRDAVANIIL